jgi:hypothetical protein
MRRKAFLSVALCSGFLAVSIESSAQEGRIFLPTPETVAIYEFNGLSTLPDGSPIPTGTTIPDLSGGGLTATVEGNEANDLSVNTGDPNFGVENRECRRSQFAGPHTPRIAVNEDNDAFEMEAGDDFTVELYVNRETIEGSANWGILAGTWHSRNVLTDTDNPDNLGAWYGFGLIRNDFVNNPGAGGEWSWVVSPVVDGVPRIGFGQAPEQHLQPFFAIPEGRHYVVLSVDRVNQMAIGYVDGVQVNSLFIDPTWTFTTPTDYEHARFIMFAGEDDPTRGAFRGSPAGTHLDAVRVQRRALSAEDVLQSWGDIESGVATPPTGDVPIAILSASPGTAIVGQCVVLDTAGSSAGGGETITKYEWRVGAGVFEEGASTREVSFDAPDAAGVQVTVRITNSAAAVSQASIRIRVNEAPVAARILASVGGVPIQGRTLFIPRGSALRLDGTSSFTQIPATALTCPLSAATPVPAPAIAGYAWDLDDLVLTVDSTEPIFDTPPYDTVGEFPVSLRVRNDRNVTGAASLRVKVVEPGTNSVVFFNTANTLVHFEFNDGFDALNNGDPVPTGTIIEDLSPNALDAVVESNDGGNITVNSGALVYDNPAGANRELRRQTDGNDPRIAINDDGNLFEMTETSDFSVELYVSRETVDGGANWGILAGTWHSRNTIDDLAVPEQAGAWYGFGLIRNDKLANPPAEWSWVFSPVVGGVPRIGFPQDPEQHCNPFFDIPEGRHYVALSVNRTDQTATGYVDGVQVTSRVLDPAWSFTTPTDYEHARFIMFSGEDDPTRGAFRGSPPGTHLDAVRMQTVALTPAEIAQNWDDICAGKGAGPEIIVDGHPFRRGDADVNGAVNITDAVRILNVLFLGIGVITCDDAADADDNGSVNITDAVRILNVLFLGIGVIGPPGAETCGPDPTDDVLLCEDYTAGGC